MTAGTSLSQVRTQEDADYNRLLTVGRLKPGALVEVTLITFNYLRFQPAAHGGRAEGRCACRGAE